jgi:squalene synthase HpnC
MMANHAATPLAKGIETRPGKDAGDENFPVASILIPRRLRVHVRRFYAFARAADDIADNPALSTAEKLRRLAAFEAGLTGGANTPECAVRLRDSLAGAGVNGRHARTLLKAFRQDAVRRRYPDWAALMGYCALSAHPVGRFMLELHGEAVGDDADALCAALQVLNHLQDCADDRRQLDRVYLPEDWMAEAGIGADALDAEVSSPARRRALDRCLDGCDGLLNRAAPLAGRLRARRLAAEVAVIHWLARRLAARLRHADPLAGHVGLTRLDKLIAAGAGMLRLIRP